MNTFCLNLRNARKASKMTLQELSEKYNQRFNGKLSRGTLSKYENGRQEPMISVVYNLSVLLGVSVDYLIDGDETNTEVLAVDEKEICKDYRKLNNDGKSEARKRVNELTYIPQYRNSIGGKPAIRTIPFDAYIMKCSAGTGLYLFENAPEKVNVVESPEAIQSDFIVPVSGNSMEPKFKDGSHVFVKAMPRIQQGEVGIFVKNGEAYIKVLGDRTLISINTDYSPIEIKDGDNVVCVGKVMGTAEVV